MKRNRNIKTAIPFGKKCRLIGIPIFWLMTPPSTQLSMMRIFGSLVLTVPLLYLLLYLVKVITCCLFSFWYLWSLSLNSTHLVRLSPFFLWARQAHLHSSSRTARMSVKYNCVRKDYEHPKSLGNISELHNEISLHKFITVAILKKTDNIECW